MPEPITFHIITAEAANIWCHTKATPEPQPVQRLKNISHGFQAGPHGHFSGTKIWLGSVVIFHKVPNMSRDMFILKKTFPVNGFLENEPVFGCVKFTLDGFQRSKFF
jgi:hypothetical protein